ncbi:MAG: hypothetical protein HY204_06390 [Nitrospirae bacterium]|nr:hypothetical protein [Nitrospirota bacterium]
MRRFAVLGFLIVLVGQNAQAASPWSGSISLEGSTVDGWVQVRENAEEGTRLRLGRDLGIRRAFSTDLSLAYHFSEQRRVIFTVGTTLLRGNKALPEFAFFDESSYLAGSDLRSDPLFYHIRATYQQTLWQPPRGDLNLLAGLEYDYLNFSVRGINASGQVEIQGEDFWKQELPIPFVGLEARYAVSERWSFGASSAVGAVHNVNSFRKEGGTVRLTQRNFDARLSITYQASSRLNLDAGYRFFSFAQEEQSHEDGNRIHLRTHGPVFQAAFRF